MARAKLIYVGIKGTVIALDSKSGEQVWATKLKGIDFVNVVLDGTILYATTSGEIFCLDAETGEGRWHNKLKGFGIGLATLAGQGISQNLQALASEIQRQQAAVDSGAGAG
jgi:outer membrane protein assembly factor BamB